MRYESAAIVEPLDRVPGAQLVSNTPILRRQTTQIWQIGCHQRQEAFECSEVLDNLIVVAYRYLKTSICRHALSRQFRVLPFTVSAHQGGPDSAMPLLSPGVDAAASSTFEQHYRISDLVRIWGLGRETVRKLVKDDPGVLRIRIGGKKVHTTYSVPESAARRIHTRLLNGDV